MRLTAFAVPTCSASLSAWPILTSPSDRPEAGVPGSWEAGRRFASRGRTRGQRRRRGRVRGRGDQTTPRLTTPPAVARASRVGDGQLARVVAADVRGRPAVDRRAPCEQRDAGGGAASPGTMPATTRFGMKRPKHFGGERLRAVTVAAGARARPPTFGPRWKSSAHRKRPKPRGVAADQVGDRPQRGQRPRLVASPRR